MNQGFSLVKVIVVVGILLVLGSIAYISFPFVYVAIMGQQQEIIGNSMLPKYSNDQLVATEKTIDFKRGDVVVFYHKLPNVMETEITKRIIGLPGETIKIENNNVYINGEILDEPYLAPNTYTSTRAFLSDGEVLTIPSDSYFLMGDNRPHSTDSRDWGFISKKDILRKVK